VRAVPTCAPGADADAWIAAAQRSRWLPEDVDATTERLGPKLGLAAAKRYPDGNAARFLLVRSQYLDVVARHDNTVTGDVDSLTPELSLLFSSLVTPSEIAAPATVARQDRVEELFQDAHACLQQEDFEQGARHADEALYLSRNTFLRSAIDSAEMPPEVPAAAAVAHALRLRAGALADFGALRDAELLLRRALVTLDGLEGLIPDERWRATGRHLEDGLRGLEKLQLDLGADLLDEPPSLPTPALIRQELLLHRVPVYFEQGNAFAALECAKTALADLLMEHAYLYEVEVDDIRPAESTNPDVAALGADERREVSARFLLGIIADAVRYLAALHRARGELNDVRDANTLLIDLSEELSRRGPRARGFSPREGQRPHLAAAMLDQLGLHLFSGVECVRDVAWQLDQAEHLLEELKEGADLRSRERFLRETWFALERAEIDLRFDPTPWIRRHVVSALGYARLARLVECALGETGAAEVPVEIVGRGIPAIIDHVIETNPEQDAAMYWRATGAEDPNEGVIETILGTWLQDLDWRRGWSIAVLRALDPRLPLAHPGLLSAIEYARACLIQPPALLGVDGFRDPDSGEIVDSPFRDDLVRTALLRIDYLVTLQESQETRFDDVQQDLRRGEHPDYGRARLQLDTIGKGAQFVQAMAQDSVGASIALLMRHCSERAEANSEPELVMALASPTIRLAARYACTADFLVAVHRAAASALGVSQLGEQHIVIIEHVNRAARWLGDARLEAMCQHSLGSMQRTGIRGVPGIESAVAAYLRAASLSDQLGEAVSSAGTLIELVAALIQHAEILESRPRVREWPGFVRRFLAEAMARLLNYGDQQVAVRYLAEAYQDLARLELGHDAEASRLAARRCVSLARTVPSGDLAARGEETWRLAAGDAESALVPVPHEQVLAETRQEIEARLGDVSRYSGRDGSAQMVLRALLGAAGSITEPRLCELLIAQIESTRGFTYHRWLPDTGPVDVARIAEALRADPEDPVLVVYVVTRGESALIVLTGDAAPRLFPIDLDGTSIEALADEHAAALAKQGRAKGLLAWPTFQGRFVMEGSKLLAPLEPYVAAGRSLYLIPHGALHRVALHTLPLSRDGNAVGLQVPIVHNPSVTNWLVARARASRSGGALVARCCAARETNAFGEIEVVRARLEAVAEVSTLAAPDADASTLLGGTARLMHLSSHGVFDEDTRELGLLVSRGGELPPGPRDYVGENAHGFLLRAGEIRRRGRAPQLNFLASCVSSRNAAFAGDDLMGLTRAFFAAGAKDLIAGSWEVLSRNVEPFADAFYTELTAGASPARAMLAARTRVGAAAPSPYEWGVFVHQGANVNPYHPNHGGQDDKRTPGADSATHRR
jgi:hypothetical protein